MTPDITLAVAGVLGTMYLDAKHFIRRDLHQIKTSAMTKFHEKSIEFRDRLNVYYRFLDAANRYPDKPALVFEDKTYTYNDLRKQSNRVSHWLLSKNVQRGSIIAMYMQNSAHFIITWLAINKIGCAPAFINNNLTDKPLLHCLTTSTAKLMLFDPNCNGNLEPFQRDIKEGLGIDCWAFGEGPSANWCSRLDDEILMKFTDEDPNEEYIKGTKIQDVAILIYTSGTTGLPKPALVQHGRANVASQAWRYMYKFRPDDRIYCTLPLYHSSASLLCIIQSWQTGCTVVISRKFSTKSFWEEVRKYDITVIQYIGEICRYLLTAPPSPLDRAHKVRMAYGNGLRPDIWSKFRDRFGIANIGEFYAATEGINSLFNPNTGECGTGAVGHRGTIVRTLISDWEIIKIDPITEEPLRGKNGFCVRCDYGEAGELIALNEVGKPLEFKGYFKNEKATNGKILRDVFKKGDSYFRSGDLLRLDRDGHFYFADRIGDTFRWKSENVSTAEVAEVVGLYPGITEANVYGVEVPGHDGRAGMAGIVVAKGEKIDFKELAQFLLNRLPRYAVPVFLRIIPEMELTGTFKQRKVELRVEGIDTAKVKDPMYWLKDGEYRPFGADDYATIVKGKAKL